VAQIIAALGETFTVTVPFSLSPRFDARAHGAFAAAPEELNCA
jgi:hypothetical protein